MACRTCYRINVHLLTMSGHFNWTISKSKPHTFSELRTDGLELWIFSSSDFPMLSLFFSGGILVTGSTFLWNNLSTWVLKEIRKDNSNRYQ